MDGSCVTFFSSVGMWTVLLPLLYYRYQVWPTWYSQQVIYLISQASPLDNEPLNDICEDHRDRAESSSFTTLITRKELCNMTVEVIVIAENAD